MNAKSAANSGEDTAGGLMVVEFNCTIHAILALCIQVTQQSHAIIEGIVTGVASCVGSEGDVFT